MIKISIHAMPFKFTPPHNFISLIMVVLFGSSTTGSSQISRVANTTLNLPADQSGDYAFAPAFGTNSHFSSPVFVAQAPGDDSHVYVVERGGTVQRVNLNDHSRSTFIDLSALTIPGEVVLATDFESGFLSMAFHPAYHSNGRIFVTFFLEDLDFAGQQGAFHRRFYHVIAEVIATSPSGLGGDYHDAITVDVAGTYTPMITQKREWSANHNGGTLLFGPDGTLYFSAGDGERKSNANSLLGGFYSGIFRIDVGIGTGNFANTTNLNFSAGALVPNARTQTSELYTNVVNTTTYRIPAGNPFIGASTFRSEDLTATPSAFRAEYYAAGLRNPFRFSIDGVTGNLFIGDVGGNDSDTNPASPSIEEISISSSGGEDFQWPYREGNVDRNHGGFETDPPGFGAATGPVFDYARNGGLVGGAASVTGGAVYRGSAFTDLQGAYIFSDYFTGTYVLKETVPGTWQRDAAVSISGLGNATYFGMHKTPGGVDGLFACSLGGEVTRLSQSITDPAPPTLLSDTGAFVDEGGLIGLSNLIPEPGIYEYDVNLALWSDASEKRRWISVPGDGTGNPAGERIAFDANDTWDYPVNTVFIKHFHVPGTSTPLETRFLKIVPSGAYGLSYRWNAAGTDATLVATDGETQAIPNPVHGAGQVWSFPSRAACLQCHRDTNNFALSFTTRQLHKSGPGNGGTVNQLLGLQNFLHDGHPTTVEELTALPAHPALNDATISRETRIRAYLDVNCAFCHTAGSTGAGRATLGLTGNRTHRPDRHHQRPPRGRSRQCRCPRCRARPHRKFDDVPAHQRSGKYADAAPGHGLRAYRIPGPAA